MTRPIDRGPQAKKHVGPFYGYQLKKVLQPKAAATSIIETITETYNGMSLAEIARVVLLGIIVACAAVVLVAL